MKVGTTVEGLPEMLGKVAGLKRAMANRILRKAVTAGCKVVEKPAKAAAKAIGDSNLLAKSIGTKVTTYRQRGTTVGLVGARSGFGRDVRRRDGRTVYADPIFYDHLVEFGTKPHNVGKGSSLKKNVKAGGQHPGAKAKPHWRPTWDAYKEQSEAAIARVMAEEIAKAAEIGG